MAVTLDATSLINRTLEITLISQPPTGGKYFDTGNTENALVVTSLHATFEVKKNLGREPNSCTLVINNMSKESRGRLERKPVYAVIRAGHNGVLRPLFAGSVTYAQSNLKVPNWETKIQIADGGRAFAHARMSRSYAPPISVRQVLADAADSMGLRLPTDLEQVEELRQSLAGGFTASAPTRDILTRLLAPLGYGWSVQDGRLQILKSGLPNANTAWVIDVDAGMIGSPEGSVPHKPGAVSELTVTVLLYPEIAPGDMIQVTSRSYDEAMFRAFDVTHKGDTSGQDWYTEIKAVPLGSPPPKKGRGRK